MENACFDPRTCKHSLYGIEPLRRRAPARGVKSALWSLTGYCEGLVVGFSIGHKRLRQIRSGQISPVQICPGQVGPTEVGTR